MATPSSSATSPSPALSFAIPATVSDHSSSDSTSHAERDELRSKVLKRAELAKITRALRSTLALASYKAKHNVVNVPFRNLEAQAAAQLRAPPLHYGSLNTDVAISSPNERKRKASVATNYYHSLVASPALPGLPSPSYSVAVPSFSTSGPQHTNAAQSLYASILGPPPAKRARTIHNPEAPPVPPPEHYQSQTNSRSSKKASTKKGKEPSTSKAAKADERASTSRAKVSSSSKTTRRKRAGSHDSNYTSRTTFSGDADEVNDTDIKAAATLTEIFLSRGAASPRSSFSATATMIGGSQGNSLPSSQTYVQSQPRSSISALPLSQNSSFSSIGGDSPLLSYSQVHSQSQTASHSRSQSGASVASDGNVAWSVTERRHVGEGLDVSMAEAGDSRSTTPTATRASGDANAPATDNEAADLMLLLANSPSPRRPTVPRDKEISRNVYAAGRVLFPNASQPAIGSALGGELGDSSREGKLLARASGGSFSSLFGSGSKTTVHSEDLQQETRGGLTVSASASDDIVPSPIQTSSSTRQAGMPLASAVNSLDEVAPAAGTDAPSPALLPGPPSPSRLAAQGPHTPNPSFNLADYINVSPSPAAFVPSPAAASVPSSSSVGHTSSRFHRPIQPISNALTTRHHAVISSPLRKSFDSSSVGMLGLGVGVGVGRRLFDGDAGSGAPGAAATGAGGPGGRHPTPLGSGIDLQT